MEQLLEFRELIKYNFGRYEKISIYATRFIINFIIYLWIFSFGMYSSTFSNLFEGGTKFLYLLIMCILGTILPLPYAYFLIAVNIFIQLSTYFVFASFLFLIMLGMILLYARIAVNESVIILITIFGLIFNVPFVAPIVAGLYFGITAFIPIILGCIIYSFSSSFQQYLTMIETTPELQEIGVDSLFVTFEYLTYYATSDNNFISYLIILIGAFFIIKIMDKLQLDYNKYVYVAICFGYFIISYIVVKILFGFDYTVFAFIVGLILSSIVSFIVLFFDTILDYSSVKFVKFEDEQNMYYVKVVPKVFLKNKNRKK